MNTATPSIDALKIAMHWQEIVAQETRDRKQRARCLTRAENIREQIAALELQQPVSAA